AACPGKLCGTERGGVFRGTCDLAPAEKGYGRNQHDREASARRCGACHGGGRRARCEGIAEQEASSPRYARGPGGADRARQEDSDRACPAASQDQRPAVCWQFAHGCCSPVEVPPPPRGRIRELHPDGTRVRG